ncbi:hypothetical protein [Aquimarina muelleri]|uniref:DNA topoisomerase IV n=1 Tax=Aquimarina muelleri TaxID=279356 RepID=A0A918JXC3_9FLAO|nr:hypothetical protein [Aquimarina muelleri]MCX2764065.1 DNA topoisomerase IV [Aquimarina muelleri]GGX28163.1 hypothetical protein GCM10007384_31820 [Aquimarina muelleri]
MRLVTLLLLLPLFITGCYQQERNCVNFHKGTFEFETFLNGELTKTTFVRNDTIEIDYFRKKSDTASIRWINDCEYILQNLHPKNMAEQKAIHIKILNTNKNTYTFEYGLVGSSNKQRGTVKKIK